MAGSFLDTKFPSRELGVEALITQWFGDSSPLENFGHTFLFFNSSCWNLFRPVLSAATSYVILSWLSVALQKPDRIATRITDRLTVILFRDITAATAGSGAWKSQRWGLRLRGFKLEFFIGWVEPASSLQGRGFLMHSNNFRLSTVNIREPTSVC